jgi:two-component system CheB/CheR fusion protein
MVIDDDADSREVLRQMVESLGAHVILAQDGQDALTRLATTSPDLIFCDLRMPRMDGFAFLKQVRQTPRPGAPPVVAVTVLGALADVQRTWAAGFDAHLVKPIDYERIRDWLARLR